MWDILEVTQEGTNDVKRARKHALIQKCEMFSMQKGRPLMMYKRDSLTLLTISSALEKSLKGRNSTSRSSCAWIDLGSLKSQPSLNPRI